MKILTEFQQANGTSIQVLRVPGGVYVSESLREAAEGEFVAGEGVFLDAAHIESIIMALRQAKSELAARFEAAAE